MSQTLNSHAPFVSLALLLGVAIGGLLWDAHCKEVLRGSLRSGFTTYPNAPPPTSAAPTASLPQTELYKFQLLEHNIPVTFLALRPELAQPMWTLLKPCMDHLGAIPRDGAVVVAVSRSGTDRLYLDLVPDSSAWKDCMHESFRNNWVPPGGRLPSSFPSEGVPVTAVWKWARSSAR